MFIQKMWKPLAVFLAVLAMQAQAAVPAGLSGSWFNPAQGGHGLSVEILDDGRAIAFWFVYDPSGKPVHLYIDGVVRDDAIVGTAYHHEGMRFGAFDPSTNRETVWGDVTLTFIDCARGVLRYDANGPGGTGYGSGAMPITRLARIGMLGCRVGIPGALPSGFYDASVQQRTNDGVSVRDLAMAAAIDPDGRLWATALRPSDTATFKPTPRKPLIIGSPARPAPDARFSLKFLSANVFRSTVFEAAPFFADVSLPGTVTQQSVTVPITNDPAYVQAFTIGPRRVAPGSPESTAFDPAAIAGVQFTARVEFDIFTQVVTVIFGADGSLCLSGPDRGVPDCSWQGRASIAYPAAPFFDFVVTGTGTRTNETYAGRGWVEHDTVRTVQRIVLVGADDRQGLGLVAYRSLPQ
jgi:hypothetical protein